MPTHRRARDQDAKPTWVADQVSFRPGGPIGILALHAGIEAGTGELAHGIGVSCGHTALVVQQPSSALDHHRPSHHYTPQSVPELVRYLARVTFSLSLHGHNRGRRAIFLGGRNRTEARALAIVLRRSLPDQEVVHDLGEIPAGLRGLNPANPVNLCRDGGVQVEIPIPLLGWRPDGTGGWVHRPEAMDPRLSSSLLCFARSAGGRTIAPVAGGGAGMSAPGGPDREQLPDHPSEME